MYKTTTYKVEWKMKKLFYACQYKKASGTYKVGRRRLYRQKTQRTYLRFKARLQPIEGRFRLVFSSSLKVRPATQRFI